MKTRSTVSLICLFLLAVPAFAHGGLQHVMGVVKSISADSITVQTAGIASKEVTVVLLSTTKFQKDAADASLKDLRVGDRVVIHAKPDGNKLDAVTVAFGKIPAHSAMSGMNMQH
jgi:Domain of unknown function (DUF5666)